MPLLKPQSDFWTFQVRLVPNWQTIFTQYFNKTDKEIEEIIDNKFNQKYPLGGYYLNPYFERSHIFTFFTPNLIHSRHDNSFQEILSTSIDLGEISIEEAKSLHPSIYIELDDKEQYLQFDLYLGYKSTKNLASLPYKEFINLSGKKQRGEAEEKLWVDRLRQFEWVIDGDFGKTLKNNFFDLTISRMDTVTAGM